MEEIDSALVGTVIGATLLLLFFSGVVIAAVVLYNKRKLLHKQELAAQETAYQVELTSLEKEVQDATLSNVARELHDNIGHRVAIAKLHLNRLVDNEDTLEIRNRMVSDVDESLAALLTSVRGLSRGLSPDGLANDSLHDMIAREVERLQRVDKYIIHTVFQTEGAESIDLRIKLVVLRILQEGISNIIHHAKADTIWIELNATGNAYTLFLRDNGLGLCGAHSPGIGLKSMQARAASIGGHLSIENHLQGGTLLNFIFSA